MLPRGIPKSNTDTPSALTVLVTVASSSGFKVVTVPISMSPRSPLSPFTPWIPLFISNVVEVLSEKSIR